MLGFNAALPPSSNPPPPKKPPGDVYIIPVKKLGLVKMSPPVGGMIV